jgi:hypothetical protein
MMAVLFLVGQRKRLYVMVLGLEVLFLVTFVHRLVRGESLGASLLLWGGVLRGVVTLRLIVKRVLRKGTTLVSL